MLTTNHDPHVYEAAAALQELNAAHLKVMPRLTEIVRVAGVVINSHGTPDDFHAALAVLNGGLKELEAAINRVDEAIQPGQ